MNWQKSLKREHVNGHLLRWVLPSSVVFTKQVMNIYFEKLFFDRFAYLIDGRIRILTFVSLLTFKSPLVFALPSGYLNFKFVVNLNML